MAGTEEQLPVSRQWPAGAPHARGWRLLFPCCLLQGLRWLEAPPSLHPSWGDTTSDGLGSGCTAGWDLT